MSLKLCHISDVHQGVGFPGPSPFSRFQDIERVLDWTADRIIAEQCQLCLISGDCFKDAKVMLDRASQEIASIVRFLRRLSKAGLEVIVISGTPSHDAVSAYELIKEMNIPGVNIFTTPMGKPPYYYDYKGLVSIAPFPGLNRSGLLTQDEYKGLPPEQIHRIMTDKITQLCIGMAAKMPNDKPKILMAHMTYQNADKGFDDLMMQQEPILTREAVSGFDLVCLGHIHRPQQINDKVFYSGPVERLSFNEEDINPGFWNHEIEPDLEIKNSQEYLIDLNGKAGFLKSTPYQLPNHYQVYTSQFIETPARRYVTKDLNEEQVKNALLYSDNPRFYFGTIVQDAIIRLRYSCSEDVAKQLNRKTLEKALYDAGSFYVSEIKADIERVDRARDTTVNESLTVPQALGKWCANQGIEAEETAALQAMTAELMESGV